ncbi:MAG: 23S rRNA (adenine(2503)-C(2))-methyltransferase RlmN [Bacteriovoracaceae bacterium]|nr:23S rRNA (adenine(2503)-C(2))-methyltransferase RlmN [Bacteriovoracaceae bacterium]
MLTPTLKSHDGTAKFIMPLHDGMSVESVLVPFANRDCVCLSTQVGCAMGCKFCHTGLMGLKRNLTSQEIIAQYNDVKKWNLSQDPTRLSPNIVFMGQGEPLHNFEELKAAIEWLIHPKGGKLGPRQITVSTSGYLPGLKRFNELGGVNLALSLHSPFDHERSELIPLNNKWPLKEVFSALSEVKLRSQQFINCEYLIIKDLNHTALHAQALAELLKNHRTIMNLIPFNPFPGAKWARPSDEEIESFKKELVSHKLRVFLRTTKGDDIMAACGQLNTEIKQ